MQASIRFTAFQLVVVTLLLLVVIAQVLGFTWQTQVLYRSCQPEELSYDDLGPYCLWVLEKKRPLDVQHTVFIGKEADTHNAYGYSVPYPASHAVIAESMEASWLSSGVEIATDRNEVLFVPQARFTGGR